MGPYDVGAIVGVWVHRLVGRFYCKSLIKRVRRCARSPDIVWELNSTFNYFCFLQGYSFINILRF